jgi:hypothetical protein
MEAGMKKVKLELDELAVESFATAEPETERGTVRGHETVHYSCAPNGASICGPNKCFPEEDPSLVFGTCINICG